MILSNINSTFGAMVNNKVDDPTEIPVRQSLAKYLKENKEKHDVLKVALAKVKAKPQYNNGVEVKIEDDE